ncbi:unnamed protein product [Trichobilharzia szidati]|nr:unnamed protein product [Trichobilharzia szidati]
MKLTSVNIEKLLSSFGDKNSSCRQDKTPLPANRTSDSNMHTGQEFFCSPHHGLCYVHFFRNATHWEAEELCRSIGGNIAKMHSDEESLFLTAKIKANFHLPGVKTIRGDDYIFPRNMPTYARWVCRRENIPGECIGSVTRRALWKPIDCNTPLTVLCGFD